MDVTLKLHVSRDTQVGRIPVTRHRTHLVAGVSGDALVARTAELFDLYSAQRDHLRVDDVAADVDNLTALCAPISVSMPEALELAAADTTLLDIIQKHWRLGVDTPFDIFRCRECSGIAAPSGFANPCPHCYDGWTTGSQHMISQASRCYWSESEIAEMCEAVAPWHTLGQLAAEGRIQALPPVSGVALWVPHTAATFAWRLLYSQLWSGNNDTTHMVLSHSAAEAAQSLLTAHYGEGYGATMLGHLQRTRSVFVRRSDAQDAATRSNQTAATPDAQSTHRPRGPRRVRLDF